MLVFFFSRKEKQETVQTVKMSEPILGRGCDEALFSAKKRGFQ